QCWLAVGSVECPGLDEGASTNRFLIRSFLTVFFFFKQKTAYDIVSDWSSDVCSSDLVPPGPGLGVDLVCATAHEHGLAVSQLPQIGRASCRERVEIAVGGV